jgi:hypothetical protein
VLICEVKCVPHACELGGGGALTEGFSCQILQTERKGRRKSLGNGYVACRVGLPPE